MVNAFGQQLGPAIDTYDSDWDPDGRNDDSRLFRGKGEGFFEDLGFEAHRSFVPSAHGPLSLIDGFINPWAKGGWRQSRKRFAFQWEWTLLLAHEMLHVPARETAMAWERHMLVGNTPTREQVEQFLFLFPPQWQQ